MTQAPAWQHPYVNVFKQVGLDKWKDVHRHGDITPIIDKFIGKIVIKISGSVPAANYLQIPKSRNSNLGLTGRFLYVQVCVNPYNNFIMHLDVMTYDQNVQRVTISNMFKKQDTKKNTRSIQIALKATHKWSIWAIDLSAVIREKLSSPFHSLKGVQLCSSMLVRGLYTSDVKYSLESLPRDVSMSQALEPGVFDMIWVPHEPEDDLDLLSKRGDNRKNTSLPRSNENKIVSKTKRKPRSQRGPSCSPFKERKNEENIARAESTEDIGVEENSELLLLKNEPWMNICHISSFTGEYTNVMCWIPDTDEVVFAANSSVIIMKGYGHTQRHLLGHTAAVCTLGVDSAGSILATGQEGSEPVIRIWDLSSEECVAILQGHASGLIDLDVSPDGTHLVAVGLDSQHRQLIVIWNIKDVKKEKGGSIQIQQVSNFNIKCIKWSLFEDEKLLSCGRDCIRMYRLKGDKLRGMSIKLGSPNKRVQNGCAVSENHIFTCITFEISGNPMQKQHHVYVGSASGAVFQVNYEWHQLDCIYQLHNGAINCMVISEGFCVMGSDDCYVRVWPLDFSDYLLEAKNEAPVTSVGLSSDGLKICVGTETGSIGVLDIATHCHATLLRSHTGTINNIATSPVSSTQFCTASSDGSIRVWSLPACVQLYQFDATGEKAISVAYNPKGSVIAAGFNNGKLRVFDAVGTMLLQECVQHHGDVKWVQFSGIADTLYTVGTDGNICLYDVVQNYVPSKYIRFSEASNHVCASLSPDSKWLAVASYKSGAPGAFLLVYSSQALDPHLRIETAVGEFSRLAFSPDEMEVWAVDKKACSVNRYDAVSGKSCSTLPGISKEGCQVLEVGPCQQSIWTGSDDGKLAMWRIEKEGVPGSKCYAGCTYMGHSDGIKDIKLHGQYVISVGKGDTMIIWDYRRDPQNAPTEEPYKKLLPCSPSSMAKPPRTPICPSAGSRQNLQNLIGASGDISNSLVWDPSTGFFAYIADHLVVIEELGNGTQSFLSHHCQGVSGLALSGDARLLASGSCGVEASGVADVCVWDVETKKRVALLEYHPCAVQALTFSPDSCWLVSVGRSPERSLVIWDVASGEAIAVGKTMEASMAVAWLPSSEQPEFVTVGGEGVLLWTLEPMHLCQRPLVLPAEALNSECCCVFCDALGRIFVGNAHGAIWAISAGTGEGYLCEKSIQLEEGITSLFVCGVRMSVGTSGGKIVHYRNSSNNNSSWLLDTMIEVNGGITSLIFDPCVQEGVVGTDSGSIWYVNIEENSKAELISGHGSNIVRMSATVHEPHLLATVAADGGLRIWDVDKGAAVMEVKSSQRCTAAQFSSCGSLCCAGYADGMLRLFDAKSASIQWTVARSTTPIVGVAFSHDKSMLLAAGSDGVMWISEVKNGGLLMKFEDVKDLRVPLSSIAMACDRDVCVGAWAHKLIVFDVPWSKGHCRVKAKYRCKEEIKEAKHATAIFSATEPHIVLYTSALLDGRIIFFDTRTSRIKRNVDLPTGCLTSLTISLNGVWLAAGSQGGCVFLIDYRTGDCHEFKGHRQPVAAVQFSQCDTVLISAGSSFLMLWGIRET